MATVHFVGDGLEVSVPVGTSILEASRKCGARVGDACGGVGACGSCHVYVRGGRGLLGEMDEAEDDVLDKAFDVREVSRLGCLARVVGDGVIEVEITSESRLAWERERG